MAKAKGTNTLVLAAGIVAVGGVAAAILLRPMPTKPKPNPTPPPMPGPTPSSPSAPTNPGGSTPSADPCELQRQRAKALADRDAANNEMVKIELAHFGPGATIEQACKSLTGVAGLLPGFMPDCMTKATAYVKTGADASYYGQHPALRALHTDYSKHTGAYTQADATLKKLDADLAALAKAGRTCQTASLSLR